MANHNDSLYEFIYEERKKLKYNFVKQNLPINYNIIYTVTNCHYKFVCLNKININDTKLIDYHKRYDNIYPKLGYFIYCILGTLTSETSYLTGGAVRRFFESYDESKKYENIDLDYYMPHKKMKLFNKLLAYNYEGKPLSTDIYYTFPDYKIFVLYYLIFGDDNLEIKSINSYKNNGMNQRSITIKYNIKGFELKRDLNDENYIGLCKTSNPKGLNCDYDANGIQLRFINYKYNLTMFRSYAIVPKNIKTYLTHLPVKLLIRLLINDIKFILGNNTLNIIISFLSEDIIYMFLVIFNITRKIIYPSHVLCTDNYNCPFNKCKKDLTTILYTDKSSRKYKIINNKVMRCQNCSTILYKPKFRQEKMINKGYNIKYIECNCKLCCNYFVFNSNYVFLNMDFFINLHKTKNYMVKFSDFLEQMCNLYNINKYSFIRENYRLYSIYRNSPKSILPESSYDSGVATQLENKITRLRSQNNKYINIDNCHFKKQKCKRFNQYKQILHYAN